MKSSRLFQIVYELMSGERMTAPELARRLEVSVRTIYRDVEALCQAGLPIATGQGQGGGIRLMDGYVLDRALMSASEQERLMLAVKALASATGSVGALLQKRGALLQAPPTHWLSVDLDRGGQTGKQDMRFDVIRRAILEKRVLAFHYAGTNGLRTRKVQPGRLCFKSSAWYLQAICLERQEWRTFKLTRMSSLHLTGECFPETLVPPPIEPASDGPTECEVTLRFPADAAFRVYDEFSGESIRIGQDGSFTVTARMPLGDGWLYGYLLSFGGTAEVLSPLHVRRGLAQFARMACQRYEKDVPEVSNLTEDVRFDVLPCSCPPEEQQDGQEACIILEQKFCHSCGMPLTGAPQALGPEKDGSPQSRLLHLLLSKRSLYPRLHHAGDDRFLHAHHGPKPPGHDPVGRGCADAELLSPAEALEERSLSETEAAKKLFGRFGGAQPSDLHSEPSDMCGRFGSLAQQGSGC